MFARSIVKMRTLVFKSEEQVASYLQYTPKVHHLTVCYESNFECRRGEGGEFAFFTLENDKVTRVSLVFGFVYKVFCFLHYALEPVPTMENLVRKYVTSNR